MAIPHAVDKFASFASVAFLAILGLAVGCQHLPYEMRESLGTAPAEMRFDRKKWMESTTLKNDDGGIHLYRYLMLDDVMEHVLMKGMPKSYVLSILGRPDTFDVYEDPTHRSIQYDLGTASSWLSIDYHWLRIDFDQNNRLSDISHTWDD